MQLSTSEQKLGHTFNEIIKKDHIFLDYMVTERCFNNRSLLTYLQGFPESHISHSKYVHIFPVFQLQHKHLFSFAAIPRNSLAGSWHKPL